MIKKALIPIAGLGTRMGPLARAVPKAMFPLVDAAGRVRPVLQFIIDEARSAGVDQIGLIVSPAQLEIIRKYFTAARKDPSTAEGADMVEFINQPAPMGFGEAVVRGANFIGDEPFMLLLGDHVYRSACAGRSCAVQVAAAHAQNPTAVATVGMQTVGADELAKVGVASGRLIGPRLYRCSNFEEKPTVEVASALLRTDGIEAGQYLAHCGIYAFGPEVFGCLSRLALDDRPMGQEIQLSDAQEMLLSQNPQEYYLYHIDGRAYDTGSPLGYLAAQQALRE